MFTYNKKTEQIMKRQTYYFKVGKEEDLKVRYSSYGKTLFNLGWYRISKDRALSMLADSAIDALKVEGINVVDPKLAKFMMI